MSRPRYMILRGRELVPADVLTWGKWFENGPGRTVKKEKVGEVEISTVCLGMDHSFGGGKPLWFETMIFGGPHAGDQWRCETYAEAEEQHKAAVAFIMGETL